MNPCQVEHPTLQLRVCRRLCRLLLCLHEAKTAEHAVQHGITQLLESLLQAKGVLSTVTLRSQLSVMEVMTCKQDSCPAGSILQNNQLFVGP